MANITTVSPGVTYTDQKTGTSGLRKKVVVFQQPHYLQNWVQSALLALGGKEKLSTVSSIVIGGDGRFWNADAIQIIIRLCIANGVKKVLVGHRGLFSTPALSAVIRKHNSYAGFILTASHNPGGPTEDFGIKVNGANGGPCMESVTDEIFKHTLELKEYYTVEGMDDIDLETIGTTSLSLSGENVEIQVLDSCSDYVELLKEVFDFEALKKYCTSGGFSMIFDSMHGVTGAYSRNIFCNELGLSPGENCILLHEDCLPDFGGHHPDPNLTYAAELVERMMPAEASSGLPTLGVASDGDGDRNMILGSQFFVTPSDSVAVIAEYATRAIPWFRKHGLPGVARSMPTSTALDRVAKDLGCRMFETPTGWKFFGNLMDDGQLALCGEESFGTGSNHIREKDGIWAVLAWLSILAYVHSTGGKAEIGEIVKAHWEKFGRSYYQRYDYETVESDAANAMMTHLREIIASEGYATMTVPGAAGLRCTHMDDFNYTDPVDKSVAKSQGLRFLYENGSRVIFRLSGTGSSGATIRVYFEAVEADPQRLCMEAKDVLRGLIAHTLAASKLEEFTGRKEPTVIT